MNRNHAIQADPPVERPITAAELLKVKEALERLRAIPAPHMPRSFANWVRVVAGVADEIGGMDRLADSAEAYADLVPGKD